MGQHHLGVARVANVVDRDGLADDYGSCYQADIIGLQTDDLSRPGGGQLYSYLVTGENSVGEGGLGTNSGGAQRPNNNPCP